MGRFCLRPGKATKNNKDGEAPTRDAIDCLVTPSWVGYRITTCAPNRTVWQHPIRITHTQHGGQQIGEF